MTAATAAVVVALALALWGSPATASGAAPTADAGGPYVIAEGDTLPLSASGSTDPELDALTYAWDLDNDGFYDDATGENPVVAWSLLSSLGVDDDGVHTVAVQVDDGTSTSTDTASLTIANTAPTVSLVGPQTALAGQSYDVDVVIDDPGADSVSSWVMTWGDGTVTSGSGTPGTQSHTYTASGLSYGITIEVTDEDGTWSTSNILVSFYDSTEKVGRFTASTGAKVTDLASAGGALDGPYDVTVGPDGLIYVTGLASDTVVRYDPAGNSYVDTFVGAGSGGLNDPKGLAFGPDGNLYVASFATGQILRYDGTTGAFIDVFVPAGTVTGPTDVVFAPDGSLLVSDNGNDNIERYDGTTGASLGVFATGSPGDGPAGMTYGNGNLFVAMFGPGVVREFNGTTGALVGTFVSSGLSSPHHPMFGPDGDLWVTDYTTEQVKRFDGSTGAALGARITESSPAGPFGAAFLPDKQVRVTDGFVVNSTGNVGDVSIGDGVCETGGTNASGADECTLRAAIEEANAASNADLVAFDIPVGDGGHSGGIWTIAVSGSPFTWVSETLTVDGTTAPTYSSTPVIVLDGSALSGSDVGLGFATDAHDSTVAGLSIVSFPDDAISVGVDRMHVHDNHLGVLPDGVTAPGSGSENLSLWGGTNALIENNLIGSAVNANIALTGATSGAVIRANIVGTDATGALDFGGAQAIWTDATGPNLVGGADPADGNVLANSTWINVQLTSGSVTLAVVGNDIYGATTLGIDLNEDGVTANDTLDGDSGANDLLNFPVPTAAPETAGTVDLAFDLDAPAGTYRIDVFANPSGTHPSGNGEGEDFIGQASVVHPGGGSSSFVIQVPATAGDVLTTTATEVTGAESYGATSEFSVPITVTGTTGPPVADAGGPYNIAEGDAVTLDGSGSVDPQLDPLTYEWDLDNDGTYGDVTGEGPTVSWSTLQAYGVDDDGVHTIGLQVDDGDETATDTGTIIVANTEPTITVTGDGTALIDQSYSVTISATDPGADTITAYRIDWGDTTFESVAAGLPATESHTYTVAALRHVTVEVTDEDGEWTTADLVVPNADVADLITRHDVETGTQVAQLDPTSPLNTPYGMTIGPDGYLYVPGYSSNSVERYDLATNTWVDTFVDGGTGGLTSANSVAFTPAGNLLVGDWTDDDILEFDGTTGAFVGTFASGGGLNGPAEMLYGPDGNLYVASALTNQVLRYNGATGAFIDVFVAAGSGGLSYLEAIAWSSDGELLVGSSSTDEVKRYDGTTGAYLGNAVAAGIGGLDSPLGISVEPDGDILVSSNVNNLVKRYAASTFTYLGDAVTTGLDAPYVSALVPDHSITVKAPLTVNSTDDDADATAGDGVCDTGQLNVAGDPECTLRAAIMQSNATGGTDGIVFDIPATDGGHAGGVWMIGVLSSLPSITDPVILDATTQTGFTTSPIVELDGGGTVGTAIDVDAGSSTIRGLVIHAFTNDGIDLDVAGGNTIAGNWIGIRANGGTAAGVGDDGIAVRSGSDGNTIGGPAAADRNVISANGGEGILLDDSHDNVVEGNYLGTDASGLVDRGNGDEGLDVNGSDNVVVRDNVISGNGGEGLQILSGNGGVYTGNLIGVGADGSTPIGNTGDGITVNFGSSVGVVIGGTGTGDGNTIAHNGDEGISIFDSLTDDVAVLGNSIHSNTALGLDLLGDGVTANDAGDADGGVNDLMNFPVITAASVTGGMVSVDFDLDVPAGDYRVEFFANPSGADASGNGEGENFLSATTVTHTGSGSESFSTTWSGTAVAMSATATEDFGGGAYGSSSEFSTTVAVAGGNVVTVNSTGDGPDSSPGDFSCDTGGTNSEGDPECTLRAAIEEANASAGIDTIEFAIPTTDGGYSASPLAYTLTPGSAYPSISTAMTIDASTQPGWTGDPIIELDGTSATGSSAGIYVLSDDTTVRGFIVHSFPDEGLEIDGSVGGGNRNTFTNNWVGFDAALTSRPNADYGILVTDVATDNVIGGTAADDANVIGNSVSGGIILRDVGTAGNAVIGNIVGLLPDAATSAPNSGGGVIVSQGASQNRIGGATPAEANTISATEGVGVLIAVDAGADNSVLGNAISENKQLGIDLVGGTEDAAGVTANDAGDVDTGPNDLLNHPVINDAAHDAGTVTVDFGIDVPAGTYRIEAFTNPTSTDGSGYGEGELFQTATSIVHTGSGSETFQLTYAGAIGDEVALTATEDLGAGSYGSTSEFSDIATVVPGTTVALVNSTGDAADAVPGDGTCDTGGTNSEAAVECTLRAAIEEANATPSIDTISFSIPTSDPGWTSGAPGFWTIGIGNTTATVTTSVTIDGTTQPGWVDDPVIAIDDTASSSSAIRLAGAGSAVRGLAIGGFTYGVYLDADAISVTGNWIGFGADGSSGYNTYGIYTTPSATNAVIGTAAEGNVIGHASTEAVRVRADDVVVQGNDLGLSPVGAAADIDSGVVVSDNAQRVRIGGTGAGEGNRITNAASNQDEVGVSVQSSANDVSILGNLIWNNVTNVDLNRDGPTLNDVLDADSGPNDLLNHPAIAVTGSGGGTVDVDVSLDVPAGDYRIEIFDNTAFTIGGLGAAEEQVHSFTVTHTGSGDETFSTSYADATPDLLLSATATEDLGGGTYGATSELSPIRSTPLLATVNSTGDASDADPTDGVCDTGATNSAAATECTLRAAIQEANVHPGATISFALPTTEAGYDAGDGFWTISVSGDLPDLASDAIVIDASTQTGYDGTRPLVLVLDDGAGSDTFELEGDDQVLRAIAVGDPGDEPIQLEADRTVIDSVWLGIDPAGNPVGGAGSFREGIIIYNGSVDGLVTNSRISGFDSGIITNSGTVGLTISGSEIFGNRNAGVAFNNSGTVSVVGNSIYDNVGLGIDLAAHDGIPLANDAGDADSGANDLLNHPVVTGVTVGAGTLDVAFDLDAPAATYRIEFFDNDSPDPSGHGEGQTFLAAATIVHPGGSASYLETVSGAPGDVLTLTSTVDLGAGDYGPTSEFSPWWTVEAAVVNSTGDAADAVAGDGECDTGGANANGDPECTLRAAIEEANANPSLSHIVFSIAANDPGHVYYQDDAATGFGTPVATTAEDHAITDFDADYPSAGFSWWQIAPATSLPVITSPVTIDATTQPGHEPNTATGTGVLDAVLRIEIDNPGVSLGYGLEISAGSTNVRGLVVDEGSNAAIRMTTAGGNTLTGSWLGPDITGDRNGSGTGAGLFIEPGSDGNAIGGSSPADRNVLSHNSWAGIWLDASGTQVANNYIGFDVLGSTVTGSSIQDNGILLDGNTNQIGVAGAGNLFGRNIDSSIWAPRAANVIQANTFIDSWDTSVTFSGPGGGNLLGGTGFGQGNLITLTTSSPAIGVSVDDASTSNSIQGNSITANDGLGIDLGASYGDGVTANDAGDVDTGANDLLNFPDISSALGSAGTVTVTFDLDAPVNVDGYRVEFFLNPTEGADASGHGEGEAMIGSVDVAGPATNATFVYAGSVGDVVTATATEKLGAGFGSTSEFSAAVVVLDGPAVVNSSGDLDDATPGDGICDTGGTNSEGADECTLRAAITEANASAVDEIQFDIPASDAGNAGSWWTISVGSAELPHITADLDIDATTQTGYADTPLIVIDAAAVTTPAAGPGLAVDSGAVTIAGLGVVNAPGHGIHHSGSGSITASRIGLLPDDTSAGNGGDGIRIDGSSVAVTDSAVAANASGIGVTGAAEATISANAIHDNTGLGIDLGDDGVTANDAGDVDTGPNDRLNFPVVTAATPTAADVDVDFDLDTLAGDYRIEFFSNPSGGDSSGNGEAERFLGAVTVTHTGSGIESFSHTITGPAVDLALTATEDLGGGLFGATSELSATFALAGQNVVAVNSTGDAGDANPGDGGCDTSGTNADGDPECTLRAAIEEANASQVVDTIEFAIPTTDAGHSAGIWTIDPSSGPFVDVTAPVTIDGTTQPGWTADPVIGIDGTAYTPTPDDTDDGLDLQADDSTVAGLAIYGFADEQIKVAANRVTVRSSWLGLDPTGTVITAATTTTTPHAFQVSGDDFTFGGPTVADGNVVASAADDAVITSTSTGAVVENNRFGVAADGVTALASPGSDYALRLRSVSSTVVRDNQFGNLPGGAIRVDGSATATVVGNLFGTDATLTASLPISNALQVRDAATVRFGGTAADDANTVRNATGDAVDLRSSSTGTLTVLGNSIVGSGGLAFDMNEDGVTANDAGDVDSGPNDLLNFGEIRHARYLLGSVIVDVDLDVPAGDYRIEIFTNPSGADPSGHGEAEVFQSGTTVTHAGAGVEAFSVSYPGAVGDVIAVSVTEDLGGGSYGATSELSAVFTVTDAAVTTVNSTGDAGDNTPGDGRCDTLADNSVGDAECTLRAAIEEANASLVVDTIEFAIPATDAGYQSLGAGLSYWRIEPAAALPTISASGITVDADSQAVHAAAQGFDLNDAGPEVELVGTTAGGDGLRVTGGSATIRGLIVNRFDTGIRLSTGGSNTIVGNYIGPDAGGQVGLVGNTTQGIVIDQSAGNVIGGSAAGERNVISGNRLRGIAVDDWADGAPITSGGTRIIGNYIGTTADGGAALPYAAATYQQIGVYLLNSGAGVVGEPGAGNVLSGNDWYGLYVWNSNGSGHTIQANIVGLDAAGSSAVGNGADDPSTRGGIFLSNAPDNLVGGTAAGEGNVIAGNDGTGLIVSGAAATSNSIIGNAFHDNAELGIDLGSDGVTANDPGDVDTGANDLLNFPTIVNVQRVAGDLVVDLQLDVAAGDHRIELFGNMTSDPSGHGEGETFLGGATVTHTGSGAETFQVTVTSPATILTATATVDLGSGSYGPSSEFSPAVPSPDLVIVNSTADAADAALGDGQCDTGGTNALGAPECTLRAAIEEANDPTTPIDTIWFAIPVADGGHNAGVWTVAPATALPQVTEPVVIDGATQPGYAANTSAAPLPLDSLPVIEIDGANAGDGVHLAAGATGSTLNAVTIGGFSGGGNVGVEILADDVTVTGSVVGLHADGVTDNPNSYGIVVNADRAVIGGATPAARNVVAGSQNGQIQVTGGVDIEILGNVIGADATTLAVPGGWGTGIQAWGGNTITIGSIAAPNVIAGGPGDWGIETGASNVTIEGNLIGTDATYSADLGDWQAIGAYDTTTVTGNVIGNFAEGIAANGSDITIVGNFIGTDPTGTIDLGNTGFGVELRGATTNVTIGGTTGAAANTIANNGGAGVDVRANTVDPAILINTIRDNGGLGIDHDGDGISPNDAGDADGLPNAPVLSAAFTDGGVTTLEFGLDRAAGTYRIDVYENPSGADPSGSGEGETHVVSFDVIHAGGDQTFSQPIAAAAGAVLSATATATGPHRSTSEFSNAITAVDEASQTLVDESVRRSDAIQLRGATAGQPGLVGEAIDLPGASSRVRGPALDITSGSLTLSAAVRPDTLSAAHAVISKLDSSGNAVYELGIDGTTGEALAAVRLTGVTVTARGGTVATGTWHSVAAVWDGADLVLFVDGVEADRVAAVGVLATDPSTVVTIGNRATGTTPFDGSIDHVVVAHDAASPAEVAATHRALHGTASYVTVGAEQTTTPGSWTVSSSQTRSGSFAVQAPPTAGADAAAWLVATGIDEPGLVFESWWWISTDTGVDLDAGTRAGSTPTDQFEAALTSPSGWELRRRTGVSETVDAAAAGAPSTGTWMRVEIWTDQLGDSRILIDEVEVTGWTTQGPNPSSGSAGLRTGALPGGESWFIDDATGRKLITPEPITTLSSLDRN